MRKTDRGNSWKKAELDEGEPGWWEYDDHVYEGERCIFCNSNIYDNAIYEDDGCIDREPYEFSTGNSQINTVAEVLDYK